MEFFRIVKASTTEALIQDKLTLANFDKVSNELFGIAEPSNNEMKIGGLWGEFTLSHCNIMGGVRFSLLDCPNALCWTVTTGYPPERGAIVVHLTINRLQKPQEFIDEIEQFLNDHCACLEEYFGK